MNRQLKRIEQTLHSLEKTATQNVVRRPDDTQATAVANPAAMAVIEPPAQLKTVSFQVSRPGHMTDTSTVRETLQLPTNAARPIPNSEPPVHSSTAHSAASATQTLPTPAAPVQPFVAAGNDEAESLGEKFKLPEFSGNLGFSRHQNTSNPDLSLNLLQETLKLLKTWRAELQQIIRTIQEIYREGPIVDGWLECSTQKVEATTQVLRHAEVSHLMGYVESLCADPSAAQPEYRLCGLSRDGRVWSSPCPPAQLASLSLAISRHQKLQPLLQRKLILEKQLNQAAEITAKVHGQVQSL